MLDEITWFITDLKGRNSISFQSLDRRGIQLFFCAYQKYLSAHEIHNAGWRFQGRLGLQGVCALLSLNWSHTCDKLKQWKVFCAIKPYLLLSIMTFPSSSNPVDPVTVSASVCLSFPFLLRAPWFLTPIAAAPGYCRGSSAGLPVDLQSPTLLYFLL